MLRIGIIVVLAVIIKSDIVSAVCGYEACPKPKEGMLNIHLLAHTHDDVGWLKTVDQYYYGSNQRHAPYGVQYILDSVISELQKNPNRRFIYVEMAFFWRWWQEQNDYVKGVVRQLVEEGRLEFVLGGWCMSDEATPHYTALIDQMTLGLKFLNETFGECGRPRVAWQIDPFGHSKEVATQFALMGFDGLFFGRIDFQDMSVRMYSKQMEFMWRGSGSLGAESDIFSGVLYNLYMPPSGFCFDVYCSDEPIIDNPKLHGYNVHRRIPIFISAAKSWGRVYKTNNVLMTMGGDFNYEEAQTWFTNLDKIIKYVNAKQEEGEQVNVFYSTPSCYLKALQESNTTWPTKDDDFFPYGSDINSYWTGYFTSRPTLKYYTYKANNFLQVCKQVKFALGGGFEEEEFLLKRAVSINQHHDAVSGTSKQHVANDYSLYLTEGIAACEKIVNTAYRMWLPMAEVLPDDQIFCPLLNISQCGVSEKSDSLVVTLYNPVGHAVESDIRIPVTDGQYHVVGPTGADIPSQLIPVPDRVIQYPERKSNATHELVFTDVLQPIGLQSYYVQKTPLVAEQDNKEDELCTGYFTHDFTVIDNKMLKLAFDGTTGMLTSIERNGETWPFKQNFFYYKAQGGYNIQERASGAYIFRPDGTNASEVFPTATLQVYTGDNVVEVHQTFGEWVSQVVRLYALRDEVEFEWMVGPIPIHDRVGKEVVTRYTTDLQTKGVFYTDANGRELQKRVRNHRTTWNVTLVETVAGNFYPSTVGAVIREDAGRQVSVIIDRPQSVSSLVDGELEFMLHRRLLYDDGKGVEEPLNENVRGVGLVVRGKHVIQLGSPDDTPATPASRYRTTARNNNFKPWPSFVATELCAEDWLNSYNTKIQILPVSGLPDNVNILTLESWAPGEVLVRLEHMFEIGEDPRLSEAVTVDLTDLFMSSEIISVREMTLGANQLKESARRFQWRTTREEEESRASVPLAGTEVTLNPMQIRTFLLEVNLKSTPHGVSS